MGMCGRWSSRACLLVLFGVISTPADGQEVSEHRPVLSPDGTRVVFMGRSPETDGDWELFIAGVNGAPARRLTHSPGWDGYAVFSPDGTSVAFDRSTEGTDDSKQPHVLTLDSGHVRMLGPFEGWLSVNDWSDDHGLLAFWERDGQRDLYLLDSAGRLVRQLTDTPEVSEHDAHFSPDGRWIVFASGPANGDGVTRLELIEPTGLERRVLAESPGRIYGGAWDPTGRKVAFTDAPDGENGDVYVVDVPTKRVTRLTEDPAWDHMPVWNATGERILFTSYRSGSERMYWLDLAAGSVLLWEVH
jgi:Tol biopolymer transport system component